MTCQEEERRWQAELHSRVQEAEEAAVREKQRRAVRAVNQPQPLEQTQAKHSRLSRSANELCGCDLCLLSSESLWQHIAREISPTEPNQLPHSLLLPSQPAGHTLPFPLLSLHWPRNWAYHQSMFVSHKSPQRLLPPNTDQLNRPLSLAPPSPPSTLPHSTQAQTFPHDHPQLLPGNKQY